MSKINSYLSFTLHKTIDIASDNQSELISLISGNEIDLNSRTSTQSLFKPRQNNAKDTDEAAVKLTATFD